MMELTQNQVLLAQGEYARVIGRSEALLTVCDKLHYALVALHIRLQTASAYEMLGNRAEARRLLEALLCDAEPDHFLLPFAENAPYLMAHYESLGREKPSALFGGNLRVRKALALHEASLRRDAETAPGAAGALRAGAVSGAAHGRTEDEPRDCRSALSLRGDRQAVHQPHLLQITAYRLRAGKAPRAHCPF